MTRDGRGSRGRGWKLSLIKVLPIPPRRRLLSVCCTVRLGGCRPHRWAVCVCGWDLGLLGYACALARRDTPASGEAQRPGGKLASYEHRPGTTGRPAGVIKEGPP